MFVAEDLTLFNRKVLIKMSSIKPDHLTLGLLHDEWEGFQGQANDIKLEAKRLIDIQQRGESRAPCLLRLVRDVYAEALTHPRHVDHDPARFECVYLVMQYLPGETLKSLISRVKRGKHAEYRLNSVQWWRRCVTLVRQLASILESLHKFDRDGVGLIYCDLKPENCVVSNRDISLIDFGALMEFDEHESQRGSVLMTRGYCAPETHDDAYKNDLNGKVDVYSLGAVLWAMLSGQKPTEHIILDNISPDLLAVQGALPKELPEAIKTILERSLVQNRDQRIDARGLKNLCRSALTELQVLS